MKPKEFKLALVQMQVKGGDKTWNIRHAGKLTSEAASNGADVALLPECMDFFLKNFTGQFIYSRQWFI